MLLAFTPKIRIFLYIFLGKHHQPAEMGSQKSFTVFVENGFHQKRPYIQLRQPENICYHVKKRKNLRNGEPDEAV